MRIVTWNCNQAFRRKQQRLLEYDPDIAIVQECENPSTKGEWSEFTDWRWVGDDDNQGLAVFTRNDLTIESVTQIDEANHFLFVETGAIDVLGVWAMNDEDNPAQRYIGQVYTALKTNPELVANDTLVAGDLNWNVIWDESPKSPLCGDFSETCGILNDNGLMSAYHELKDAQFGTEDDATFFMHKKESRPYHIDYVFVPRRFIDKESSVTAGTYEEWIESSDHVPLFVDIDTRSRS